MVVEHSVHHILLAVCDRSTVQSKPACVSWRLKPCRMRRVLLSARRSFQRGYQQAVTRMMGAIGWLQCFEAALTGLLQCSCTRRDGSH